MSAAFPCNNEGMRAHCVSSPLLPMSDRFLNDCSSFHADCVSHCRPVKSSARGFARRPLRDAKTHLLGALVFRVGVPPTLA
jgi:hypothetical protein